MVQMPLRGLKHQEAEESEVASFMMAKGLGFQEGKYTEDDWVQCLANLQEAFSVQTKAARRANARFLLRRLHHRATNVEAGLLLGHKGRAADLLALLTAVIAEAEGTEECRPGETWGMDWWMQVEVYIPIQFGSLAFAGRRVPHGDPAPMLFMRELPESSPEPDEKPGAQLEGDRRVHATNLHVNVSEEDLQFMAEAEREAREERTERERQVAWMEQIQRDELRAEEEAMEKHKAMIAQDYEDWAIWDELNKPRISVPRKRQMVHMEIASGSTDTPRVAKAMTLR
eukprot:s8448_g4.t1